MSHTDDEERFVAKRTQAELITEFGEALFKTYLPEPDGPVKYDGQKPILFIVDEAQEVMRRLEENPSTTEYEKNVALAQRLLMDPAYSKLFDYMGGNNGGWYRQGAGDPAVGGEDQLS